MVRAHAPRLHNDPSPGPGHPIHGLQDHLPSSLLRSSKPAADVFTPILPASTSSRFSHLPMLQQEPKDSSSTAASSAHWGSLKAAWERPLLSPSPWSPGLSKQALCPALPGSSPGLDVHMSPSPLPSLPTPPLSNISPFLQAPPSLGLFLRPCATFER